MDEKSELATPCPHPAHLVSRHFAGAPDARWVEVCSLCRGENRLKTRASAVWKPLTWEDILGI